MAWLFPRLSLLQCKNKSNGRCKRHRRGGRRRNCWELASFLSWDTHECGEHVMVSVVVHLELQNLKLERQKKPLLLVFFVVVLGGYLLKNYDVSATGCVLTFLLRLSDSPERMLSQFIYHPPPWVRRSPAK